MSSQIPVSLAEMCRARDAIHLAKHCWSAKDTELILNGLATYEQMLDALLQHGRVELVSQDAARHGVTHPALAAHQQAIRDTTAVGRFFPLLTAGDYALSIQASDSNYCEPDANLPTLGEYSEVEIAVQHKGRFINIFDLPADIQRLVGVDPDAAFKPVVAGHVAWPDVERLYLALVGLGVGA